MRNLQQLREFCRPLLKVDTNVGIPPEQAKEILLEIARYATVKMEQLKEMSKPDQERIPGATEIPPTRLMGEQQNISRPSVLSLAERAFVSDCTDCFNRLAEMRGQDAGLHLAIVVLRLDLEALLRS